MGSNLKTMIGMAAAIIILMILATRLSTQLKVAQGELAILKSKPAQSVVVKVQKEYINLSDEQKRELALKYNMKIEELNGIVNQLQREVTEYQQITSESKPAEIKIVERVVEKKHRISGTIFSKARVGIRYEENIFDSVGMHCEIIGNTDEIFTGVGISKGF